MKIRLPEFREATLALALVLFASTVNAQAPPTCPPTCALPGQPGGPPPGAPGGLGGPPPIGAPGGPGGGIQPGGPQQILMMQQLMRPPANPPGKGGGMQPGMGGGMAGGPPGMGGGMAGGPPGMGGGAVGPQSQPRSADQGSRDRTGPGGARGSAETNRADAGVGQTVVSYVGPTNDSFVRPGNTATTRSFLSRSPLGNR